jgi:CheY-like chemotaxis protein
VDDDLDSRNVVCHLLENEGASVATAGSASDAFARFRQLRPDVLVSDIAMPERGTPARCSHRPPPPRDLSG